MTRFLFGGRPTLIDVARAASVSTATVDRVLNKRGTVKARTIAHVIAAAESIGYLEPASRSQHPARPALIDFILPGGSNNFMDILADRIVEAGNARATEATVHIHRIEGFVAEVLAETLLNLRDQTDGVAIIAIDHPLVREAIRNLASRNIPVLTLVSDISNVPRIGYVGVDNRAAGRLAGHIMGRFVGPGPGKVAVFAGSLSYRGHEEREMGFRHSLAEDFPDLKIVQEIEIRDDIERAYQETRKLLENVSDLRGIYDIGAVNRGIARAIEDAGRNRNMVFIGHELTEHTRRFLLSGTMDAALDQNPRAEAREAIDQLIRAIRGETRSNGSPIRIEALFRENIPDD